MKREYKQPIAKVIIYKESILSFSLTTNGLPADSQPAGVKRLQSFDYMYDDFDAYYE